MREAAVTVREAGMEPLLSAQSKPNILFILTDQERFFRPGELPAGFRLPAHERLMARGTTFVNHRINSCVCTPSRSVLYTGRHIQQTRMFDNTNFPWIGSLSTEIPTLGHMLRDLGYYAAYKGKWHLTKEFETVNKLGTPTKIFTQEMEAYGFSDYFGVGDIIAHERGGYLHALHTSLWGSHHYRITGKDAAGDKTDFSSVHEAHKAIVEQVIEVKLNTEEKAGFMRSVEAVKSGCAKFT